MGTISIGIKRLPKKEATIYTTTWEHKGHSRAFVAICLTTSTIQTIDDFCRSYIDVEEQKSELKMYKENFIKYVIETRNFAFGATRKEALNKLGFCY